MRKHPRSFRGLALGVESLEERFLLSGIGSSSRGVAFSLPAAQVASRDPGTDAPEDEPAWAPEASVTRSGGRLIEADDLPSVRTVSAGTNNSRVVTIPAPASNVVGAGGLIAGVRAGLDGGPGIAFDVAGTSAATAAVMAGHQGTVSLAGAASGDRPPGGLLAVGGTLQWPTSDLPAALRERRWDLAWRNLKQAAAALEASHPGRGVAWIAPPRGLGPIADALPVVQATIEHAFDRLLAGFAALGAGASHGSETPARWIPWLVLTATAGAGAIACGRHGSAAQAAAAGAPWRRAKIGRHGMPGLPSAR
jgi:hypothetical protein